MKNNILLIVFLAVILLLTSISITINVNKIIKQYGIATTEPVVKPESSETPINYAEIAELINIKRSENGTKPALMLNLKLNYSAQLKANDMASKDYWAHNDPDGNTPWRFFDQAGYDYLKAGENLAKCYNTPQEVVEAWYASPKHKDNMLGDYKEVGFGTATMKNGCLLIVNHFGKGSM